MTHSERLERRRQMAAAVSAGATAAEVSRTFGVSVGTVRNACMEAGINWERPERPAKARPKLSLSVSPRVPWSDVNWSLPNQIIAETYGVSYERVRQVREQLNKPKFPAPGVRAVTLKAIAILGDRACGNLTNAEVAQAAGVSTDTVSRWKRKLGVPKPADYPTGVPWSRVNWQLGNRDLAILWGVCPQRVAGQRMKMGAGKPRWNGNSTALLFPPEMKIALAEEKAKVREWQDARGAADEALAAVAETGDGALAKA